MTDPEALRLSCINWLTLDSKCKGEWEIDVIHNKLGDTLFFRKQHPRASNGVYLHIHDGFIDFGKYEHAYDNIGSAVFFSILLMPLPVVNEVQVCSNDLVFPEGESDG